MSIPVNQYLNESIWKTIIHKGNEFMEKFKADYEIASKNEIITSKTKLWHEDIKSYLKECKEILSAADLKYKSPRDTR